MKQSKTRNTLFHSRNRRLSTFVDISACVLLVSLMLLFVYRSIGVLHYNWEWKLVVQGLFRRNGILLSGFLTTLRLSFWSSLIALLIGTAIGIGRLSASPFFRLVSSSYVHTIRNLPPLVLVFLFYFFFSSQLLDPLGIDQALRRSSPLLQKIVTAVFAPPGQASAFLSALLTLGIYEASYIAEIIKSGIRSIDRGQWEASYALGFSSLDRLRYIILPQAFRRVLPALAGQLISTMKDSSIVSVISIAELTFQGMELSAATYRTFEIWIAIMLLYFLLSFSCSHAVGKLERRLRRRYSD